jgi:hypothetical protein
MMLYYEKRTPRGWSPVTSAQHPLTALTKPAKGSIRNIRIVPDYLEHLTLAQKQAQHSTWESPKE